MYSILIKDAKNIGQYRFLTIKQEVMEEKITEITDPETNEVRTESTLVGTGTYETVTYSTFEKDELEEKCIELLKTYNSTEFIPVDTLTYNVDLLWNSDNA